jgi:arylsulfatase A-like enzyme
VFERFGAGILLLALVLAYGFSQESGQTVPPDAGPNVVVVMADDLDAGLLKGFSSAFPNITALRERGVSFGNAFATDPLCCPSRATFLTGRYSHNTGVWDNAPPGGGWSAFKAHEPDALPVWLDWAGYETALFGRYLNRYDGSEVPPGWDEWGAVPLVNDVKPARVEGYRPDGRNAEGETHTQVLAKEAADFVRGAGGPFFLHVTPYAPHAPGAHPAEYGGLFAGVRAPRNPAFDENDVSDKPPWIRRLGRLSAAQESAMDAEYRDRLRSTKDVDDMVGEIAGALRDSGKLDETYFVFTSDHGYHLGQHRLKSGKWMPYGHDTRVPLIVAGPRVPAGVERNALVGNHDLAPTVADWTGAEPSAPVDGTSIASLLASDTAGIGWRDALLTEAAANPGQDRPAFRGVITRRYVYVSYGGDEKELYDRRRDPYQIRSRPDLPAARWLDKRLDTLVGCSGASCRAAEGAAAP